MRKFNKNNCRSKVRAVVEDRWGRKITLMGTHAYEWSIVMETNGKVVITSFPSRKEANKEFKALTKKR